MVPNLARSSPAARASVMVSGPRGGCAVANAAGEGARLAAGYTLDAGRQILPRPCRQRIHPPQRASKRTPLHVALREGRPEIPIRAGTTNPVPGRESGFLLDEFRHCRQVGV